MDIADKTCSNNPRIQGVGMLISPLQAEVCDNMFERKSFNLDRLPRASSASSVRGTKGVTVPRVPALVGL
jgi:hypothetical protein